jgi:hypothetical protein
MSALGQKQTFVSAGRMSALSQEVSEGSCGLLTKEKAAFAGGQKCVQKQTCAVQTGMSALPPKADMCGATRYVRFVPIADSCSAAKGFCYSITSSARASSEGGTVRPSAFAVLRLITNWYLFGDWTGRSAGFAPLRMRST